MCYTYKKKIEKGSRVYPTKNTKKYLVLQVIGTESVILSIVIV